MRYAFRAGAGTGVGDPLQLDKRAHTLLHPSAPCCDQRDNDPVGLPRPREGFDNLVADRFTHRAAEEVEVEGDDDDRRFAYACLSGDCGFPLSALLAGTSELLFVPRPVQWVFGDNLLPKF